MFCPALRSWTDGFCRPRSGLCSNLSVGGGQRGIVLFQTTQLVFAARAAMTWLVAPGSHGGLGGHREQCTSLAVAATARDGSARRVPLQAPATGTASAALDPHAHRLVHASSPSVRSTRNPGNPGIHVQSPPRSHPSSLAACPSRENTIRSGWRCGALGVEGSGESA
jgi:hypothetical protein